MKKATNFEEYISTFPVDAQRKLKQLRTIIIKNAPQAQEVISYGMPAFKQNGMLLYFAAFKNHIGFYPMRSAIIAFSKELSVFKGAVGSVQFPLDKPLPLELITRIVQFRVKENASKVKAKTTETTNSVAGFVKKLEDKQRQIDCFAIIEIMKQQSGLEPKMWGPSIIGFGTYHYIYDSGREGDAPLVGFSPRKSEFALYIANFSGKDELLKKLGKHTTAKACVYIKKVADIDTGILKKMITAAIKHVKAKYK